MVKDQITNTGSFPQRSALLREPGLQPVNILRKFIVDDTGLHGFLTDLVRFFKRTRQIKFELRCRSSSFRFPHDERR
jgi:hypothetical protein